MSKLDTHRRFFKEDIKVARDYNRKSMGVIAADNQMGKQILQEWAVNIVKSFFFNLI